MKVQGIVVSSFGNVYTVQISSEHLYLNTENPIEKQILEESLNNNLIITLEDGKLVTSQIELNDFIHAIQLSEEEEANEI